MIVQNKHLIDAFTLKYQTAKNPLKRWVKAVENENWNTPAEVKNTFLTADYVGNGRYVFNIKGNSFRLVAVVVFVAGSIFLRWIGTHKDYDKIDVKNI
jgi:mRNA interferase HigB